MCTLLTHVRSRFCVGAEGLSVKDTDQNRRFQKVFRLRRRDVRQIQMENSCQLRAVGSHRKREGRLKRNAMVESC